MACLFCNLPTSNIFAHASNWAIPKYQLITLVLSSISWIFNFAMLWKNKYLAKLSGFAVPKETKQIYDIFRLTKNDENKILKYPNLLFNTQCISTQTFLLPFLENNHQLYVRNFLHPKLKTSKIGFCDNNYNSCSIIIIIVDVHRWSQSHPGKPYKDCTEIWEIGSYRFVGNNRMKYRDSTGHFNDCYSLASCYLL